MINPETRTGNAGVHVVEVVVAADHSRSAVIRNLVETVLIIDDFALDTVADVKLGVDEVCSQLIAVASQAARLRVKVATDPEYARIEVSCDLIDGRTVDEDAFGWFVIRSVTDNAHIAYTTGKHGPQACVALTALRA